jgi:Domain of unknown function (DUF2703)
MSPSDAKRRIVAIDFLYLDLEVCTRCRGTDASLNAALTAARGVLKDGGADVRVTKTLVDSEQKARALGFLSSPTIRVNGRDIALEFRESPCEAEACACAPGGGDAIDCRVWVYQGKEYTEAPVPMIVDAILSVVYGAALAAPRTPPPADVPENLLRLFRSRERDKQGACCDARRQESCCEPSEKAPCCGAPREADARACGCE